MGLIVNEGKINLRHFIVIPNTDEHPQGEQDDKGL